jgi:DNA-binding protein HU-beta
MANPNALQEKVMLAMNRGARPKLSKTEAARLKKQAASEALAAKIIALKKQAAKAPAKTAAKKALKQAPKQASKTTTAQKVPLKKAAASKRIARKTMKRAKKKTR